MEKSQVKLDREIKAKEIKDAQARLALERAKLDEEIAAKLAKQSLPSGEENEID